MSDILPDEVWLQFNRGWKSMEECITGHGTKYIRADLCTPASNPVECSVGQVKNKYQGIEPCYNGIKITEGK